MPQDLGLNDPLLLNEWFAVAWTSSLPENKLEPVRVLGQDLVLWRTSDGVHAWRDLCVHRGAKLSLGRFSLEWKGCLRGLSRIMAGSTTRPANACESPRIRNSSLRRAHMWSVSPFKKSTAWCGCVWAIPLETFHPSPKATLQDSGSFRRDRTNSMRRGRASSKIFSISRTCPSRMRACLETRQMRRSAITRSQDGGRNRRARHSALATRPGWHRPPGQGPLHVLGRTPFHDAFDQGAPHSALRHSGHCYTSRCGKQPGVGRDCHGLRARCSRRKNCATFRIK